MSLRRRNQGQKDFPVSEPSPTSPAWMVPGTAQPAVQTATGQLWEPREQPQAPLGVTAVEVTGNGLPDLWLDYTLSLGSTREDKGQTDGQLEISRS